MTSQADFLDCGYSMTPFMSTVRSALSTISLRWSRKYRATSALASCATASFHSALAALSLWAERSRAASSRSCNDISEQSKRNSSGGSEGCIYRASDFWDGGVSLFVQVASTEFINSPLYVRIFTDPQRKEEVVMGVEMSPVTLRLGEAEHRKLEEIEMAFAPFIKGRSATIRFAIEVLYGIIFTSWTLLAAVDRLQGILRPTLSIGCPTPKTQLEFEFPSKF